MKRLSACLLLAVLTPLILAQPTPQPAEKPRVIRTPAGDFEVLPVNSRGYAEFKRLRDGAVMVLVREGAFEKWTYHSDPSVDPAPRKMHVPAFLMDKHEITNAQAAAFLGTAQGLTTANGVVSRGTTRLARSLPWGLEIGARGATVRDGLGNHPFVGGTGHFALEYAAWVGAALPYAYEWEKAASGPSGLAFPWGMDYPDSTRANLVLHGPKQTMPVGSYPQGMSPFGCMDMAGNVYERVYPFEREQDIKPGEPPIMIKGGSWATTHWANVRAVDQDFQRMDTAESTVGFRTVIRDPAVLAALGVTSRPVLRIYDEIKPALEEAAKRNVPVFLFLSFDTCGQSDRTRAGIFGDERFITWMNENVVVLAGHHPGDSANAPVDDPEGPSVMYPGCRAEKLRAVYSELCEVIDIKRWPQAVWDFKQSPGQFALNPHEDLFDSVDDMILVGEDGFPKGGEDVQQYLDALARAQKELGPGQSRADYLAGKPAPKTAWKPK
ncbi:MAG: formylglycine-generating enzyme family protein [Planctomycetes bacterium]|nr:formylglycine-generating enzyme family protein [Planctomycetota bacterium]